MSVGAEGRRPQRRQRGVGDEPTFTEIARREQITRVAIAVIAENGYARTSLARIAEAAGLSNAAVLYYFKSKNAVLEGAYASVIGAVSESIYAAMVDAASAKDSIEAYVRSLVSYMVANPTHMRLLIEVLITSDNESRPANAGAPPRWTPLADAMTRAQADGDLRPFDARTYAIVLGGAIDAIFAESLTDPDYNLARAIDELITLFQRATDASNPASKRKP